VNEFENPNHPIFKEKWNHSFELSDGSFIETVIPDHQKWHDLRCKTIFSVIDEQFSTLNNVSCLDVACASGFWSLELASRGANVRSFDANAHVVQQATAISKHRKVENVNFECANIYDFEPNDKFDLIFCFGLMYHLTDPLRALIRLKEWSKGLVMIDSAVSNLEGSVLEIGDYRKYRFCGEGEFSFVPTSMAMEEMMTKVGFKFRRVIRLEEPYTAGNFRALWLAR
jgi:SAM-dependent methyltransferase